MPTTPPRIFYLVGPTAVGKTAIAAEVAEQCNCEIISADAFQVYEGMDILTAKPPKDILERVPHHLIGVIPPTQSFDVAQFQATALDAVSAIYSRGKFPLVVGGTGLYVRALTHGLADLPQADPSIRAELDQLSLEELQARYQHLDPIGATQIDTKNPRRLVRAIEVCLLTGKPFSSFREEWDKAPENAAGIFLNRERSELNRRIDQRTIEMVEAGLFEEVQRISALGSTASQVIGLKEARAYLVGKLSRAEAIQNIQQITRRYAKRQVTWFKRESHFEWVDPARDSAVEYISRTVRIFFH